MSIWRVVDPWFPALHVWWLEPRLKAQPPEEDDVELLIGQIRAQDDPSAAASAGEAVASAEHARVDGLESKLDGNRAVVTAISPFALIVLGWAISASHALAIVCAALALLYLVVAYFIAFRGGSASRRFIVGAQTFTELAASRKDLGVRVPATKVLYARSNTNYGVRLGNYIWAAQRSAVIAVLLTAAAATLVLAAGAEPWATEAGAEIEPAPPPAETASPD